MNKQYIGSFGFLRFPSVSFGLPSASFGFLRFLRAIFRCPSPTVAFLRCTSLSFAFLRVFLRFPSVSFGFPSVPSVSFGCSFGTFGFLRGFFFFPSVPSGSFGNFFLKYFGNYQKSPFFLFIRSSVLVCISLSSVAVCFFSILYTISCGRPRL